MRAPISSPSWSRLRATPNAASISSVHTPPRAPRSSGSPGFLRPRSTVARLRRIYSLLFSSLLTLLSLLECDLVDSQGVKSRATRAVPRRYHGAPQAVPRRYSGGTPSFHNKRLVLHVVLLISLACDDQET